MQRKHECSYEPVECIQNPEDRGRSFVTSGGLGMTGGESNDEEDRMVRVAFRDCLGAVKRLAKLSPLEQAGSRKI